MTDQERTANEETDGGQPMVDRMPGRNGGWLKVGNPGHDGSNAGAPKSRVRKNAGVSCEAAIRIVCQAIEDSERATDPKSKLRLSEALKAAEVLNKIAYGERTELVLDSESILGDIAEVIGEWAKLNGIAPESAMGLYGAISERLKDR